MIIAARNEPIGNHPEPDEQTWFFPDEINWQDGNLVFPLQAQLSYHPDLMYPVCDRSLLLSYNI